MQEARVRSLGQEDILEKEMATHSDILAWKIPRAEELGGLQSMALLSPWGSWVAQLSYWARARAHTHTHTHAHTQRDLESPRWAATELQSCPKSNDWAWDMNININKYVLILTSHHKPELSLIVQESGFQVWLPLNRGKWSILSEQDGSESLKYLP